MRLDLARSKQLYFKSSAASTTYDEGNYAKSINTNEADSDEERAQKTSPDTEEYAEDKDCSCDLTEDYYYDYEETEELHTQPYNDYNYAGQLENEYDDVDYEPGQAAGVLAGEISELEQVLEATFGLQRDAPAGIVNDVDGYIRLTEEEISDILSGAHAVEESAAAKAVGSGLNSESPITCTSF